MEVVEGDLWDLYDAEGPSWDQPYVVVPTNTTLRRSGAVMGRGVAHQAAQRFPDLPKRYAKEIAAGDFFAAFSDIRLYMFPVKRDWRERADIDLIVGSCRQLRQAAKAAQRGLSVLRMYPTPVHRVVLPLVGCGFGELTGDEVLPLLHAELPEPYFTLVKRAGGVRERYGASFAPTAARRDAS